MCYSAQVRHDYAAYARTYGADIDVKEFVRLYWHRQGNPKIKIPKSMDAAFAHPQNDDERTIKQSIEAFDAKLIAILEQDIFKQRKRLADAQRSLLTKSTKAASESKRIATDKVAWSLAKLGDLARTERKDRDARIFPAWYAPVIVMERGKRVVKPMRYQCRPEGKPAFYDTKYPGTYNARRDNLDGFWRGQFGVTHGIMIVDAFYENVSLHRVQQRELMPGEKDQNVVLEFRPKVAQPMLAACLWSRWHGTGEEELLSFAAITDDPPPEIALAGHDRCIIPIKPENVDAWLAADSQDLTSYYRILDDRERPYYEYRIAA